MAEEYTQARIRVSQRGALLVREALLKHEQLLLEMKHALWYIAEAKSHVNADLKDTRRVLEEVERTIDERGWDKDEQERPDPTGTGTQAPAGR